MMQRSPRSGEISAAMFDEPWQGRCGRFISGSPHRSGGRTSRRLRKNRRFREARWERPTANSLMRLSEIKQSIWKIRLAMLLANLVLFAGIAAAQNPPAAPPTVQPVATPPVQNPINPPVQTATPAPQPQATPGAVPSGSPRPNIQTPNQSIGNSGVVPPASLPAEPPPIAPDFKAPARPLPSAERVGVDVGNQLPLTLDQAIEMALQNNNNIDVSRNNVQIAEFNY